MADDGLHVELTVGSTGLLSREELEAELWRMADVVAATNPAPITLHVHRNARLELEFLARDVPAYGYTTFWLQPGDDATLGTAVTADAAPGASVDAAADAGGPGAPAAMHRIENAFFTVEADPESGALTVTHRPTDTIYSPCNVFVDGGDAGDSYTFAPPAQDTVIDRPAAAPQIEAACDDLGATLRIVQELRVPVALNEARSARAAETTTLRICSLVTLTHDCPRIDVQTTVDNTARDHRLRVRFRAPFAVDHVHAEGAFEVVRRPLRPMAVEGTALEDPVPDAPQHSFILCHDGARGLAVANVGLPEYEASSDGRTTTLALSLLRCVGWLSRDDLPTRRGGAGPALEVPEAQCPGTHTFTYSLIPYAGDWRPIVHEARRAQLAPRALPAQPARGHLPASGSFLTVDAPGVVVSAIKGAEDGHGVVVRLYNVADEEARGALRLFQPVRRVERLSLDEHSLEILHHGEAVSEVPLALGPCKIETLRLTP